MCVYVYGAGGVDATASESHARERFMPIFIADIELLARALREKLAFVIRVYVCQQDDNNFKVCVFSGFIFQLKTSRMSKNNNENVFFLLLCCYSVYFEILKISIIKKFGLEFDVILHFPHSGIPTSHKASNRRCRERIACAMHTNRDLDKSAVG